MKQILLLYIFFCLLIAFINIPIGAQNSSGSAQSTNKGQSCPESAFVHTDRDLYVAGENMFFKMYVTSAITMKTIHSSSLGYMVLRNQKSNILNLIVRLNEGSSFGCVYLPDTLKSGVYELVAFTNFMRNYGESIFFRKELLIVNRFDKLLDNLYKKDSAENNQRLRKFKDSPVPDASENLLKLVLEKDSFTTREKIRIAIKWSTDKSNHQPVYASLSVKAMNPLTHVPLEPITVYSDTIEVKTGMNVFPDKDPYLVEEKGIYLKGQVRSIDNKPVKDECLFISTIDTAANLQYSFSNDSGNFQFLLDNYYLGKNIVLKSWKNEADNGDNKIELEDKFALHNAFIPHLPYISINLKKYIYNSQEITQIRKSYHTSENTIDESLSKDDRIIFPYLYFNPDAVVYPANFMALDNFKEINANILPGSALRRSRDIYHIFLFDFLTKGMFARPAPIFLDGVFIDNANPLIKLNSDDIEKIELCKSVRVKGELEFPGLVSVITKKRINDFNRFKSSALIVRMDNYSDKVFYKAPAYDKDGSASRMPDFRQLLYWNPEITLRQGATSYFEFFSSDNLGDYLVEIRGFDSDGIPVSAYSKIKVYRQAGL